MYTFIVLVVVSLLSVVAYYLYIKQKGSKLDLIDRGICPECECSSIEIKRSKGGGCSGTTNVIYCCHECGYEEEFNVSSRCGGSGCIQ